MWRGVDARAVAILFSAITAWFADVLFLGRVFYLNDLSRYHFGMKRIVRDAMLSGNVQWHDAFGGGQPLAANPAFELFYPPQWLVLLPDLQLGITLHIVVHFYLCAAGLYFLLRSLGAGATASTTGTVAFVLGGPLMSLVRVLPFLFSVAWMPLVFLFARRALLTRSRRDVLLAGFFGGMQALVGEPVTLLQTWLMVAAYGAYRAWHDRDASRALARNAVSILAAGLVAFAIAAAQLIPAIDFSLDSVRSRALPRDVVMTLSTPASRSLELALPTMFQARVGPDGQPLMRTIYEGGDAFIASAYIGLAIALAFVAGLFAQRRGYALVLVVGGIAFLLALGDNGLLLPLLYDVGLFQALRYPEKFFIAVMLVAVIWGALALDRILRGDAALRTMALRVTIAWTVVAALVLITSHNIGAEWRFWAGVAVRGVAAFAVLVGMQRKPEWKWGAIVVLLTLADVAHVRRIVNPTMPGSYFDPPASMEQLPENRGDGRLLQFVEWIWAYGSPEADAYFAAEDRRWWAIRNAMMPRMSAGWGVDTVLDPDYDATYLLPTANLIDAMREMMATRVPAWQAPLLAMSNVHWIARLRPLAVAEQQSSGDPRRLEPVDIVPNPSALPRFYFADRLQQGSATSDFVRSLVAGGATPRTAFVDVPPFVPSQGEVLKAVQTPGSIALDVQSAGRALLVLSVTPHRYWRATLDGAEKSLLTANVGYQALEVGPGRHSVRLTYANPLIVPSAVLSVIALLATLIVALRSPRLPLPPEDPLPPANVRVAAPASPSGRKIRKR